MADEPSTLGNPNNAPERTANSRAGNYDNERAASGRSVDSGRGSLQNDCFTVGNAADRAEAARGLAEASAALSRQGK